MTMVLITDVPTLIPAIYGKYRNRITYVAGYDEYVARVRVIRRKKLADGSLDPDLAEVEVYVPDDRRAGIEAPRGAWVDAEYLRCTARLSKNRKSLRDFFDSGELERAV
ncbi:hypothetical protein B0G62_10471 [Paraburkholderia eburnea]|uniref:Uncharacterized protein n=1 Tax=Paraburkholderia eburnea TaxID=1189126 RepID=A0A2S4MDH9_9BURK|nr:hypothetical protein [Paraburkholderia eburnea]POR52774.1 hypothetical protein B0G62_10471 [Paraburkholderia eburnea]PRZ23642.1 hypothetical protein BX588_10471 [Paraburkholderia eburnea]